MSLENGDWLTLSQAAQLIGVHPSTLRLWSDEGQIPVHRTLGKHRRYLRQEVELWSRTVSRTPAIAPESIGQYALARIRFQISESHLEAEPWYQNLDDEAKRHYQQSGRSLIQGLSKSLVSEEKEIAAEADSLGYEYAVLGRRCGLSSLEASRVFLFFRNALLKSVIAIYQEAKIPAGAVWENTLERLLFFTDRILLNLLVTYRDLENGHL